MQQKRGYATYLAKAKSHVVGISDAYQRFVERVSIDQKSKSLVSNYGRSLAAIALHFSRLPSNVLVAKPAR